MTIPPTSESHSTILAGPSVRRFSCSPPRPPRPKLKQRSLRRLPRNPSLRPSAMPSLVLPSTARTPYKENILAQAKTHWPLLSRNLPLPVRRSERPDWPRMPRFRADFWPAGVRRSIPTSCLQHALERPSRTLGLVWTPPKPTPRALRSTYPARRPRTATWRRT